MLGRTTTPRLCIDTNKQLKISLLAETLQIRIRDVMDLNDIICCTAEANTGMKAPTATTLLSKEEDVGFLFTTQDSVDFTNLESTSEGFINTQPETGDKTRVDAFRAIMFC